MIRCNSMSGLGLHYDISNTGTAMCNKTDNTTSEWLDLTCDLKHLTARRLMMTEWRNLEGYEIPVVALLLTVL